MATNLDLPKELLEEAVELGNHKSKRAAVEEALRKYVGHQKRLKAREAFGTFDFDEEWLAEIDAKSVANDTQ